MRATPSTKLTFRASHVRKIAQRLKTSPKETFGRTEAVLMLRVSSFPNRYQGLIFVKRRTRKAPETPVAQSFTALPELATQLHLI
jgi:hypothetical protein